MLDDRSLIQLLESGQYHDQHAVQAALANRGIHVTQSTLSRHLARLGYRKVAGRYRRETLTRVATLAVLPAPPNLLILRTHPGYANALAAELDEHPLRGQIGCVAGDDTVLVAVDLSLFQDGLADAEALVG